MAAEVPASSCVGGQVSGDPSPISNVREQDRFLHIANISRIMKKVLPCNGKTTKDAKEAMQQEKRKTNSGDDLLRAIATVGFEDYIEPLKLFLHKYREIEGDGKGSAEVAESSGKIDAGGFEGGNLSGPNMQVDMKMLQQDSFTEGMVYMIGQGDDKGSAEGEESSGKTDVGDFQGGNLSGPSIQADMKMLQQDSFTEGMSFMNTQGDGKGSATGAESSGKGDEGDFQGGNLSGPSMQADMKMLQQDSFTEGMSYINTQGDGKGCATGAESSGKGDEGGFQGGNLSGPSMQADMKMLQEDSFTEGMSYMNTQVAYLRFSVFTLL